MDVNIATFIALLLLGTGIFTLLAGVAMLKFGNNKRQGIAATVIGLVVLALIIALYQTGPLEDAELVGGIVGFIGAVVGAIAGFAIFLVAIMKS